ncbi:hypothetical protein KQI63_12135 [bacterium]|nr:hypothetical protein [bacterium]
MDQEETKPTARDQRFDRILFAGLALVLLAAAIAVTVQMIKPSSRQAVEASLIQDGLGIISAAQTWVAAIPEEATESDGPFAQLRFDRIGYFDGVLADGRSMVNEHGRFSLIVAPDNTSFTLEAVGPDEITVEWRGVGTVGVPDPRKQ